MLGESPALPLNPAYPSRLHANPTSSIKHLPEMHPPVLQSFWDIPSVSLMSLTIPSLRLEFCHFLSSLEVARSVVAELNILVHDKQLQILTQSLTAVCDPGNITQPDQASMSSLITGSITAPASHVQRAWLQVNGDLLHCGKSSLLQVASASPRGLEQAGVQS
jgi:hypothetical protein